MEVALRADGWTRVENVSVRGRAFDEEALLADDELGSRFADAVHVSDTGAEMDATRAVDRIAEVAAGLEGFFAVVVEDSSDGATYLVADGARSIPLYYDSGGTVVSDRARIVRETIGAGRDPIAESGFLLTRYVTGPDTIWSDVHSTQAGEIVRIGSEGIARLTYREFWPSGSDSPSGPLEDAGRTHPISLLRAGFETAIDRTERVAGDRPVVVPLSGGYDSRLIAAALTGRGREVIAFTFGRSGHPDVEVSREVAAELGIRWEFVPYSRSAWYDWYHGVAGRRYRERAFGGDHLPFLAEWPALRTLVDEGRIPTEALFCPGHTVATPGERVPYFVGEGEASGEAADGDVAIGCGPAVEATDATADDRSVVEPSVEALVDYVLDTHYSLWDWDDDAFRAGARERIRRGLLGDRISGAVNAPESGAAAYERWEWRGRMTTFTNGDLRAYEDARVEWWLPLWDPAYVRAWQEVPLPLRRGKHLHAELAIETYRRVAGVSRERAAITDRTISPVDRCLSLLRYTPELQFVERGGDWMPPFLVPRSRWAEPGTHPLAWYGAIDPEVLDRLPPFRNFYALRTLAETGRIDFTGSGRSISREWKLDLPTKVRSQIDSSSTDR